PVALAFSLTAAVVSTLIQTLFGILSGYLGGRVDEVIQRFTEFMMIIPMLPIMILISFVYRISIWTLLVIVIVFSLVGSTTKVVRSMVPQIKEESYILAAISYGASPWRIMFLHIFPRVLPYTFSILALSVPGYVFLEAALSYLGLGDPVLPTWGRILGDAYTSGAAYYGYWWWILIPAGCIMMTALAFALLGYAFDKVVNPRLREM
ncbi:ABC transporter permease, partial [Candidatus Bathyarchaeota archaeon]